MLIQCFSRVNCIKQMKKTAKIITILFSLFLLTNVCFSQEIDLGKVCQRTYTNELFGLKIEFPKDWLVSDSETESFIDKDPREGNFPLVSGYRFTKEGVPEKANLQILAVRMAGFVGIKTSQDILKAKIKLFELVNKKGDIEIEFSEIKSATISGRAIDYLDIKSDKTLGRYYVFIKNGFAIDILIEADNKADFEEYAKLAEKISLDYKK